MMEGVLNTRQGRNSLKSHETAYPVVSVTRSAAFDSVFLERKKKRKENEVRARESRAGEGESVCELKQASEDCFQEL